MVRLSRALFSSEFPTCIAFDVHAYSISVTQFCEIMAMGYVLQIECLTGKLQASPQPGPADEPAPEKAPAPAKTRVKAVAESEPLPPPKASEVAVKSEKMAPTALPPSVGKGEELASRDTCSESISSEILDADSPRTMDSTPALEKASIYPHVSSISAEINPVDSNIIHMTDHLCDQMLSPQACQRISVKLEDGSFQDESSCNYILTQLDEERGLPWWDWP